MELELDSPNFDPKRYILSMLKQHSLKQLIQKSNEIEEDIKQHDHEIQSLVFENYSKFISSIDTVRSMKDNICMVDSKLKVLQTSMEKISELALKIDGTFSVKRKEIQKLDTINKDLQKLKNLCDFPNLLKQDLAYYKSLPDTKPLLEAPTLFTKSIEAYLASYHTLLTLRDEPLIAPIYRESQTRVEELRTILRGLQSQLKTRSHSASCREVTKKLIIVSEDQMAVLRSYMLPWKERLSEPCFKGEKPNLELSLGELLALPIPEPNEHLWTQVTQEVNFLNTIRPLLRRTEELELMLQTYLKDFLNFVLTNYSESAPLYCTSLRAIVQVNHLIVGGLLTTLSIASAPTCPLSLKEEELITKTKEKSNGLVKGVLSTLFGRAKLAVLKTVGIVRKHLGGDGEQPVTASNYPEVAAKLLASLKESTQTNFKLMLNDLEYLRNAQDTLYMSHEKFVESISSEVEGFLKALCYILSKESYELSEELPLQLTGSYHKLSRTERQHLESAIKDYLSDCTYESPFWFPLAQSFLSTLSNHLGKKLIENFNSRLEMGSGYDFGRAFKSIQTAISGNLLSFANYFAEKVRESSDFKAARALILQFNGMVNQVFTQSRRGLTTKPSFLAETTLSHETEILTAKKLHIFEKPLTDRNSLMTFFLRKLMKNLLVGLRLRRMETIQRNSIPHSSLLHSEVDVYCLIQLCYQLSNVEEEAHVTAFFSLIQSEWAASFQLNASEAQTTYAQLRNI